MKQRTSGPAEGLQAWCQQADERAAQWRPENGLGSTANRDANRSLPKRWSLLKGGLVVAMSALTLMAMAKSISGIAVPWLAATAPATNSASQLLALATPAPPSTSMAEPIRWQDGELVVSLHQVPLAQAIALLARATQTTVSGMAVLRRSGATPTTVQARFVDTTSAWSSLLRDHGGFSIACSASSCHLWITSEHAAASAAANAERALPGASGASAPAGAPANRPETESQPGGSCEARCRREM